MAIIQTMCGIAGARGTVTTGVSLDSSGRRAVETAATKARSPPARTVPIPLLATSLAALPPPGTGEGESSWERVAEGRLRAFVAADLFARDMMPNAQSRYSSDVSPTSRRSRLGIQVSRL